MAGITAENLLYALLGGFLPALLWLWFWIKEDRRRPEPRGILVMTFFAGMIAVLFALAIEHSIFLAEEKIKRYRDERAEISQLSNEMQFRNPRGYVEVYDSATLQNVLDEVRFPTIPNHPLLLLYR